MVLPYITFTPFSTPQLEVHNFLTQAVLNVYGNQKFERSFYKKGIKEDSSNKWYDIQTYFSILKEISIDSGPFGLFKLGKYVGQELVFPQETQSLKEALENLEEVFKQLHRNGDLGTYTLLGYDEDLKESVVECKNPYPCYFDRGLLTQIARRFLPEGTGLVNVELDNRKPSRLAGGDRSFYHILWL